MRRRDDNLELPQFVHRHVDGAVGANVRLDALEEPKPSVVDSIQPFDVAVLLLELGHRHAAGNRQPVRMIGHGAELIAAREAGVDDPVERLAAVAPDRMHLQVAVVVRQPRPSQARIVQRGRDLCAAQEMGAQRPPLLDVFRLTALRDRLLDDRRRCRCAAPRESRGTKRGRCSESFGACRPVAGTTRSVRPGRGSSRPRVCTPIGSGSTFEPRPGRAAARRPGRWCPWLRRPAFGS